MTTLNSTGPLRAATGCSALNPTRHRVWGLAVALTLLTGSTVAWAAPAGAEVIATPGSFYLSADGNDTSDGQTPSTAWRTLNRANQHLFAPGNKLLLQAGSIFPGMLYLDQADAGDPTRPVVVASYGDGRATISSAANSAVFVYNTGGVEIRELNVLGGVGSYQHNGGISFYNDRPGGQKLAHLVVTGVDVRGFKNGIEIGGGNGASGFRDVSVTDARVHGNMEAGLITYGPNFNSAAPTYAHEKVRVARVEAFANLGDPTNMTRNTGNGIVLGSVADGLVEQSSAHGNGGKCRASEGPAGIWAYDATQIVLQDNLSYSNRTGGPVDGDGFDFDQNVSSSVMQRNLSYDNDGAGFLVYTAQSNSAQRGNVVRFNVSSNDARRNAWYGGITIAGRVSTTNVYGNTVVMGSSATVRPPAVRLGSGLVGVTVRNNALSTSGGSAVLRSNALDTRHVFLQGNNYSAGTSALALVWGNNTYPNLAAFRSGTGQEMLNGNPTGLSVAPGLRDPQVPKTITRATQLREAQGFMLSSGSALRGRGLDLSRQFGTAVGSSDYFGTPFSSTRVPLDIGAHQASAAATAASSTVAGPSVFTPARRTWRGLLSRIPR